MGETSGEKEALQLIERMDILLAEGERLKKDSPRLPEIRDAILNSIDKLRSEVDSLSLGVVLDRYVNLLHLLEDSKSDSIDIIPVIQCCRTLPEDLKSEIFGR